jgi:D-beta-D-heptose 7-phosphate kinase/D-beta-D-heptose 1-phosphate adenosyltransferase
VSAHVAPARAAAILDAFASKRILILGDLMLDEFVWGRVSRLSPEAPVPIVEIQSEEIFAGGAANVARNLQALGAHVTVAGRVGTDHAGKDLVDLLARQGIDTSLIIHDPNLPTTVKTRVIARDKNAHVGAAVVTRPHHYVRMDRERRAPISTAQIAALAEHLDAAIANADAVIIEDYAKGFITQPVVDLVADLCRRHHRIWTVDPSPANPLKWPRPTAIKPNRIEAFAAAEIAATDDSNALEFVGQRLLEKWNPDLLLVTLGEDGMRLFERNGPGFSSPARAREVFDVSGAGDTAIAAFTLALAAGAAPAEATDIANHASGIVVAKLGTATVSPRELRDALGA